MPLSKKANRDTMRQIRLHNRTKTAHRRKVIKMLRGEAQSLPVKDIEARLRVLNPDGIPRYYPYPCRIYAGEHKEYVDNWRREHPDRVRASRKPTDSRRRARLRNAVGSFTATEWRELLCLYRSRCAYCGKKSKKLTVDHIIPLVKGGTNTIDNVAPACGKCNSSKRDKLRDAQRPLCLVT